jgi:hypothetical protein
MANHIAVPCDDCGGPLRVPVTIGPLEGDKVSIYVTRCGMNTAKLAHSCAEGPTDARQRPEPSRAGSEIKAGEFE